MPEAPQANSGGNSRPVPDPTVLTTEQLLRAIAAERDYVNGQLDVLRQRLAGIDEATVLRVETGHTVQVATDDKISHLEDLVDERFTSIATQFKERDTRSERESRDNKVAVDAAFAAQKEAAAKQDEGNQKAIDKSEKTTNEAITKNAATAEARAKSQDEKIDDLKERVTRFESMKLGGREATTDRRDTNAAVFGVIAFVVTLLLALMAIIGFVAVRGEPPSGAPAVMLGTAAAREGRTDAWCCSA